MRVLLPVKTEEHHLHNPSHRSVGILYQTGSKHSIFLQLPELSLVQQGTWFKIIKSELKKELVCFDSYCLKTFTSKQ